MSPVAFTVLFIQTEDVLAEKENKNLKVCEKFAQGNLCVELEGLKCCMRLCIHSIHTFAWHNLIIL